MKRSYLLLVLISVLLLSCSKEELTIQPTKQASVSLDVRQYDKWIYFSFLNGIIETPVETLEKDSLKLLTGQHDVANHTY